MTKLTKRQLFEGAARVMSGKGVKDLTNPELEQLMTVTQYVTDLCLNELEERGELGMVGDVPFVPYVCEHHVDTLLTRDGDRVSQYEVERLKAQIVTRAAAMEPIIAAVLATVPKKRLREALNATS